MSSDFWTVHLISALSYVSNCACKRLYYDSCVESPGLGTCSRLQLFQIGLLNNIYSFGEFVCFILE